MVGFIVNDFARHPVLCTLSANSASDGASAISTRYSTRGPIGRSSSMQAGSEKTWLGKHGLDTYYTKRLLHCKRVLLGAQDIAWLEALCHCLFPNRAYILKWFVCVRVHRYTAPFHDRPTGRRSNVKDSIRKKENQKESNRQYSHFEHSCSCILLANHTRRTPNLAECSASGRS